MQPLGIKLQLKMGYDIQEQFNIIYEKLYPAVVSYFRKRTDDDAEDLAQITFMKLWAYLPCLDKVKNAKSLVFSIAKYVYCDKMRQKKLFEISENDIIYKVVEKEDFTKLIEIQMEINRLPYKDREIVKMKQLGCSSREIGRVFNLSASAVRTRLQQIRKTLKDLK